MSFAWRNHVCTLDTRAGNSLPNCCLEKIDNVLCEDHFTCISDDIKHDVPFVELCNDMILTYYNEVNVDIDLDIEFNDGCASQFKCIRAISLCLKKHVMHTCLL